VSDLKSRLGLDTQLIPTMNWGSLGVVVEENLNKLRVGLAFFGEGTKLLVSDIQYVWLMLSKAVQGYTLKPREVNAIRRTAKDMLTLIPFTIILIIPLSPIGHVLVFTFIQRFFPEFYPSCYTEKRLNLKRLFAEVEVQGTDELLGDDTNDWGDAIMQSPNPALEYMSSLLRSISLSVQDVSKSLFPATVAESETK